MTPDEVIAVWLEAGESHWFTKDAEFDGMLSVRFGASLREARLGTFDHWTATARGSLGLVLLLDQVSRNIHRNSALAFAGDARALEVAKASVARGDHQSMPPPLAMWFVMPFEHAEDLDCQERAVSLFAVMGQGEMVHWAKVHRDIIARFGRFPHRNAVLGRPSRPEEVAFLKSGGFSG